MEDMKTTTEYVIEGQDPEGEWRYLGTAGDCQDDDFSPEGVAIERRTMMIGMLRGSGVTRYKGVRIKKITVTEEIIGGQHVV